MKKIKLSENITVFVESYLQEFSIRASEYQGVTLNRSEAKKLCDFLNEVLEQA